MAPLVVKGKVLVGNSGGEFGVRGWLTALDAATGKHRLARVQHRARQRRADRPDVQAVLRAGPRQGPRRHDAGRATRGRSAAAPSGAWSPTTRSSTSSTTAPATRARGIPSSGPATTSGPPASSRATRHRRGASGSTSGARTTCTTTTASTRTSWSTSPIGGATRKVLLHPDRNGYLYVLDRATGQVLSADPFVPITTSTGVDLKTGALDLQPGEGAARRRGRSATSARRRRARKDWQPSACSPRTRLLYIPHQNLCQDAETYAGRATSPARRTSAPTSRCTPAPGGHRGEFTAWDPVARKKAWAIKENFPVWSGALATAGDVVFYGTMDGWFKAVDAQDRRAALAVQDRLRNHRPADHLPRAGRQAVRRHPVRRRRLGRRDRRAATSTRATRTRGARLRQRDEGPAAADDQGRHAVCLRAAVSAAQPRGRARARRSLAVPRCARRAAAARQRAAARLRRPDNLPFSQRDASGFENRIAALRRRRARHATLDYVWRPQRRGFVRKTLGADAVRRRDRRAGRLRARC